MGIKCLSGHFSCYKEPPREFICDTDADFENLPDACPGSKAISLWSKKERVVNSKGRWVPYGEYFVGAPIIDLVEVEDESGGGGTIEYGKEYKFKSAEKIYEALVNNTTTIPYGTSIGGAYLLFGSQAEDACLFTAMDDGAEGLYSWHSAAPFGDPFAEYFCVTSPLSLEGIEFDVGWYYRGEPCTPPTCKIPTEDTMMMAEGATLELMSLFFEVVETKKMLTVTDTNDEGIVASYEVYADEALVDTVPKAETIDATALGVTAGASVTVKAKSIIDTTSEASNAVIFE